MDSLHLLLVLLLKLPQLFFYVVQILIVRSLMFELPLPADLVELLDPLF